jgi:hypothetical protein
LTLNITIDTQAWQQLADKFDQIDEVVEVEIRRAVRRAMSVIETNVVDLTPLGATKNLSQSWATEVRSIPAGVRGELGSPLNYALPVEKGRRAGRMPPIDPIHLWVVRKGIAPPETARQVAFLIARAIGRRGTKGAKMLEKGVKKSEPMIQRIFDDVAEKIIRSLAT